MKLKTGLTALRMHISAKSSGAEFSRIIFAIWMDFFLSSQYAFFWSPLMIKVLSPYRPRPILPEPPAYQPALCILPDQSTLQPFFFDKNISRANHAVHASFVQDIPSLTRYSRILATRLGFQGTQIRIKGALLQERVQETRTTLTDCLELMTQFNRYIATQLATGVSAESRKESLACMISVRLDVTIDQARALIDYRRSTHPSKWSSLATDLAIATGAGGLGMLYLLFARYLGTKATSAAVSLAGKGLGIKKASLICQAVIMRQRAVWFGSNGVVFVALGAFKAFSALQEHRSLFELRLQRVIATLAETISDNAPPSEAV